MNCDFVARGESEEDVLNQAAKHAEKDHGLKDLSPEMVATVKSKIHDE
jgi:predicted small metal-binding protein